MAIGARAGIAGGAGQPLRDVWMRRMASREGAWQKVHTGSDRQEISRPLTTAQAMQAGGREASAGSGRQQKAKRAVFKSKTSLLASETAHKTRQVAPAEALSCLSKAGRQAGIRSVL